MKHRLNVDLEKFWEYNDEALKHNCFNMQAKQIAMGLDMSDECVFAELGEPGEPWGVTPRERRIELNKRYNDKAEEIVGRRLLDENFKTQDQTLPAIRRIGEVFGGEYNYVNGSEWLESDISTPQELEKMLNRIDRLDFHSFLFPSNWESEKNRIFERYGIKPSPLRWVRGPVTLATSIYGVENLIFLILDQPDLAKRFSDTIFRVIDQMAELIDTECGFDATTRPKQFSFADDNCCLLNAEMYEFFAYPIIKRIFDKYAPGENDRRFQHSDSDMEHLLPVLSKLNFTGCNFGPTLTVSSIRKHMPKTCIWGQLAPFTFMSNDEDAIIAEVKRDCEMARETRGLKVTTAGSVNNGSLLTSMRAVMFAIQEYGRF